MTFTTVVVIILLLLVVFWKRKQKHRYPCCKGNSIQNNVVQAEMKPCFLTVFFVFSVQIIKSSQTVLRSQLRRIPYTMATIQTTMQPSHRWKNKIPWVCSTSVDYPETSHTSHRNTVWANCTDMFVFQGYWIGSVYAEKWYSVTFWVRIVLHFKDSNTGTCPVYQVCRLQENLTVFVWHLNSRGPLQVWRSSLHRCR